MKLVEVITQSREEVLAEHLKRADNAEGMLRSSMSDIQNGKLSGISLDALREAQDKLNGVRCERIYQERKLIIGRVFRIPLPAKPY